MENIKTKLIDSGYIYRKYGVTEIRLDAAINDFIKDKKVIDIKFQANVSSIVWNEISANEYLEEALVIYRSKD